MFEDIRKEFPILKGKLLDRGLVYLDSAATTQKPQVVIDRLIEYYTKQNANIHRGPYSLSISMPNLSKKSYLFVIQLRG